MMIPIVSIVGKSGTGKTTLIEKLVPELKKRGRRVATVKHDVHGFEMDREGKDTWRHKRAGAYSTAISSVSQFALVRDMDHDMTLAEIRARYIRDVDIIISEGYKKDVEPKIEIFRKEAHSELLSTGDDNLAAIIGNSKFERGVPCFDLEDIKGLADFIEKKFLGEKKERMTSLRVNGVDIPLKPFVADFIEKTLMGMVSSLRGCDNPEKIEISIG